MVGCATTAVATAPPQGFPLHQMRVPKTVSDRALGKMGGNTMHLHSVGLALLMGIRLLKDPVPATGLAVSPRKTKAVFVDIDKSLSS